MDSSTILEKFLDARADVEEIIAPSQLRKWFPKSVNSTSLQIIYEILHADRQHILGSVKESIKREFDVPVDPSANQINSREEDEDRERPTLPWLLSQLQEIEKTAEMQDSLLDQQIDECANDIESISVILEELANKNDRLKVGDIDESMNAIDTLVDIMTTKES